jgi:hypothetical protein
MSINLNLIGAIMIIKSHTGAMRELSNMHNYKKQTPLELSIVDWCNQKGVSMAIDCMGAQTRDKWECDAWNITFYRKGKNNGFNTCYYTGTAHRVLSAIGVMDKKRIQRDYKGSINLRHMLAKNEKENARPQIPHIAGILHSLTLDASANDYSFNDWCDNFGYESDSIKALSMYQACCAIAKELYSLFNRSELCELSELLQDY